VGLDLDFPTQLAFHVVSLNSGLIDHLKSNNKPSVDLPGEIDPAELTLPETTPNFEIDKGPHFGGIIDASPFDSGIEIRRSFILVHVSP
jgi:hypothetical protein